jgi:hypothetical protein
MKNTIILTAGFVMLFAIFVAITNARPPRPGGPGPFGGPFELMDTDEDGKISEEEWNAYNAEMFKELDKNGNGYLTEEELRPPREKAKTGDKG